MIDETIVRLAGNVWIGIDRARGNDTFVEWTVDRETGVITFHDWYQNPCGDRLKDKTE